MKKFSFLLSLLCIYLVSLSVYSQQDPKDEEILRIDTSLVFVPVKVTDRNNKNITDLKKENFRLFEDGIEQEIASFESVDAPFTIALLLDVSDSTKFKTKEIQDAAIAFVENLRPEDRVLIFAFNQNLVKIADVRNSDVENLSILIRLSENVGRTSLYQTVETVANDYLKSISGKKAIVLFTDGIDTASYKQTFASSLKTIDELDAIIYPIQYETVEDARKAYDNSILGKSVVLVTSKGELLTNAYKRGTLYLRILANKTGGKYFLADSLENLSNSFSKIVKELREQYGLSFYPKNQDLTTRKRKIKVELNIPKAVTHTRKTYIPKTVTEPGNN
ncbi:MAG: VWA domain-containing protein [Acidobacteriota bacterium]|jgi:VWFA-related protein|nr:VWA domain-containing protein [Acidobacteriota bacterium]